MKASLPSPKDLTQIVKKRYESKKSKTKVERKRSTRKKIEPPRDVFALSHLSDKELEHVYDDDVGLESELGLRSFKDFCEICWGKIEPGLPFVQNAWHNEAIAEHLTALHRGDIKRLLIAVPPGVGKSTWACVFLPSWIWLQTPHWKMAFGSYGYLLAGRDAAATLKLMDSTWFKKRWGHRFKIVKKVGSQITNDQGGLRIVASVGGQTLGIRADLVVADDPLNIQQAASEVGRAKVHRWWLGMTTRGDKTQRQIVIQQRLHDDDLIGHLMKADDYYTYLELPAEFEAARRCVTVTDNGEPLFTDPRTKEGECIFPAKFDTEYYAKRKLDPETAGLADAMFRQDPVPEGGNIIKKKWFRYYQDTQQEMYEKCPMILLSADTAIKEKSTSSFTVIQIWGKKGPNIYLIDQFRARLGFTGIIAAFKDVLEKWPRAGAKLIEDKASGPDVIDTLKDKIPGLIPSEGNDNKEDRMHAITWMWQAGNIWVPGTPPKDEHPDTKPDFTMYPWMSEWYDEIVRYPMAVWTDQAMAMSQALMYLAAKAVNPRALPVGIGTGGNISELRRISQRAFTVQ
jgi:predicted phage terminase large subunit-like protein